MGNDMPAETSFHVMELLSDPLVPEREASRQVIEQRIKEHWSRACRLWNRPDLGPKFNAKQKRTITPRTEITSEASVPVVTPGPSKY